VVKGAGAAYRARVRRTLVLLLVSVVGGVVFGRVMSQLPIPRNAHVFWIGDLRAPWLVLAFLAGRVQRRWSWAVLAGVLTDVGCVNGFYSEFLFAPLQGLGLPPGTSTLSAVATDGGRWLLFIAPWLAAAGQSVHVHVILLCEHRSRVPSSGRWRSQTATLEGARPPVTTPRSGCSRWGTSASSSGEIHPSAVRPAGSGPR